jgi:hypothetical protein
MMVELGQRNYEERTGILHITIWLIHVSLVNICVLLWAGMMMMGVDRIVFDPLPAQCQIGDRYGVISRIDSLINVGNWSNHSAIGIVGTK